jgi:hypothetical protein
VRSMARESNQTSGCIDNWSYTLPLPDQGVKSFLGGIWLPFLARIRRLLS